MAVKELRINNAIRVKEVRLIDSEGNQRGVATTSDALALAREAGLDLVEIAPQASPPVCRILDYGKYKFEQEKRIRDSKRKQKLVKIKEIRMQPKIEKHDLEFKTNHIREFLDEGNKVKVTVRFRGREMAHTELGRAVLERVLEFLDNTASVERPPQMEGRFMSMTLNPKVKK